MEEIDLSQLIGTITRVDFEIWSDGSIIDNAENSDSNGIIIDENIEYDTRIVGIWPWHFHSYEIIQECKICGNAARICPGHVPNKLR